MSPTRPLPKVVGSIDDAVRFMKQHGLAWRCHTIVGADLARVISVSLNVLLAMTDLSLSFAISDRSWVAVSKILSWVRENNVSDICRIAPHWLFFQTMYRHHKRKEWEALVVKTDFVAANFHAVPLLSDEATQSLREKPFEVKESAANRIWDIVHGFVRGLFMACASVPFHQQTLRLSS